MSTETSSVVQPLFSLDSKRFVVCGAGQGIGAACARALSTLGANVLCVDRDADLAKEIADEIDGSWVSADLITSDGVAALLKASGDRVVAYLASPAARMVTGHTPVVDGGTVARDPFYGDPVDESLV